MITKLTPNLMAADIRETVLFYQETLGFSLSMAVPKDSRDILTELPAEGELVYALMRCGDVEIMFQEQANLAGEIPQLGGRPLGASATLYMETGDLDKVLANLPKTTTIIRQPETTWYGARELYIQDNNGYILAIAQMP